MKFIRRLLCKHDYLLERTIHGDEVIISGFKRSLWRCTKCGKRRLSEYLNTLMG